MAPTPSRPARAVRDPHRTLLRDLDLHRARLGLGDPADADRVLDHLVHLRLLADLGIEPDHLASITRSDHPWTTFLATCQRLGLPTTPTSGDTDSFAALCRRLAPTGEPLPIDLQGRIHERSLAHHSGARKRGGVFYTPTAIVHLLLETTLGPQLADKSPEQLATFRVCDLACGAGSFLLGAYEHLLAAHERWYAAHPEHARRDHCEPGPGGRFRLSLIQRQAILERSIFGADIDPHAVELATRALHLRLLAGHPGYRPPAPAQNLRCLDALDPGALERSFPAVLSAGGFDTIVGNPPYVRPHNLTPEQKRRHRANYSVFRAKADLYACFIQRACALLRPGARLGYIVARSWLALDSFDHLRRHILAHYTIDQLIELPARVFPEAQVETLALVLQREPDPALRARHILTVRSASDAPPRTIPQRAFTTTYCNVFDLSIEPATEEVKASMRQGPSLGSLYDIAFGLKTGDDAKFLHTRKGRYKDDRPLLRGDDVRRYGHTWKGEYVWYVPEKMRAHKPTARPGEPARFEQPKLLVKDTSKDFGATYEDGTHYVKDVLIVLPRPGVPAYDLKALLGILNSQALRFYYRSTFPTLHVQSKELASLPLPRFDLATRTGRAAHDRLVALVEQRLALAAQRPEARAEIDALERRIDTLVQVHYGVPQWRASRP